MLSWNFIKEVFCFFLIYIIKDNVENSLPMMTLRTFVTNLSELNNSFLTATYRLDLFLLTVIK